LLLLFDTLLVLFNRILASRLSFLQLGCASDKQTEHRFCFKA